MIVFPAVDIKDGVCVRLSQGQADAVTVFQVTPLLRLITGRIRVQGICM